MDLADKVVLISGGGTGIGRATAEVCVREGATVVVCGRREQPLQAVCDALGAAASWCQLDVTEAGAPARAVATALERHGRLDVLVNNAATFLLEPLAATGDDALRRVIDTNLVGLLALTREAIPALTAAQGAVVNVSSVVGQGVLGGSVVYAATKAAVDHLTRCLAMELGPDGVRVNCVSPGTTVTDMSSGLREDPEVLAQTLAGTPLGARLGEPLEVAEVIAFLASERARWVTGQIVQASGGLLL